MPSGSPRHYDPATLRRQTAGAVLPALPPHSGSPRARGDAKVASFALLQPAGAGEAGGGWLRCLRGGNTLPAAERIGAHANGGPGASPPSTRQLGVMSKCSKQLTEFLTRLIDEGAMARDGTAVFCAIAAEGVCAEQVALVAAPRLGMEACLSEGSFTRAREASVPTATTPCQGRAAERRLFTGGGVSLSHACSRGVRNADARPLRPTTAGASAQHTPHDTPEARASRERARTSQRIRQHT